MPKTFDQIGENQGGGDPNILKLEATNLVRPLDNAVADWKQHTIEDPNDDSKVVMVVCPGPRTCPLCRKPSDPQGNAYFPVSRRYAVCVWDCNNHSIKVLIGGPQIFDEFKGAAKVGINPTECDWSIVKEGERRNTKYTVIRHNPSDGPEGITPDQVLDVAKYEEATSPERIFDQLTKFGIDYDSLPIPNFTLDEALAFVMPYTAHKGLTVEALLDTAPDFAEWLHGTKLEQGQLGDPVFIALQTAMEAAQMVPPLEDALASIPETPAPAAATPPAQAPLAEAAAEEPGMPEPAEGEIRMFAPNGLPVNVPEVNHDSLIAAGFTDPEAPAEEPDPAEEELQAREEIKADTPVKVILNGTEVELPYLDATKMVQQEIGEWPGGVDPKEAAAAPPAGAETKAAALKVPLPDEQVVVKIGEAEVPMLMAQAEQLWKSGSATFVDPEITAALTKEQDKADKQDVAEQAAQEQASPANQPAAPADDDLPNKCPTCGKGYKSKGGLTQHENREHGGQASAAQSQPAAAAPQATDGATATEVSNLERVKDKVARAPFAKDYEKILELFENTVKKRALTDMNDEELLLVEAAIDAEAAAA